jgi:mRNA-degrading endonuclease toxin of MazEF toxin-antitoxin module
VVNVSQVFAFRREDLTEKIGTLGPDRVWDIVEGIRLFIDPMN